MAYVFRRGGEEGGGEKRNFPNFESGSRRVVSSQVSSSRNWQHAFGTASSVVRCERSYRYDPLDGCSHRVIVRKRTKLRKKNQRYISLPSGVYTFPFSGVKSAKLI